MPSERFLKLKTIKKRNFLRKAYKEFALHSYEGASITQLVADLKMAKGSIYQYFNDKEDLYTYLIAHAQEQLYAVVEKTCPLPSKEDAFEKWVKNLVLVQLKFLLAVPSYASLFMKHEVELESKRSPFLQNRIKEASVISNQELANEKLYYLHGLPLVIFKYVVEIENCNLYEKINSESSIEVATDKLLYLCESFLE